MQASEHLPTAGTLHATQVQQTVWAAAASLSVLVLTSASSPTAKIVLTVEQRLSARRNVLQKLKLQSVIWSPVATLLSI